MAQANINPVKADTNPAPAGKSNKGKILAGVGLVLLCVLGYFGYNWYEDQRTYVTTENAKVSGDIINASSKIAGKVVEIKVQNGSKVKKGDVLFILDKDQMQAQTNQAQGTLDVAKAQLAKVTSGARAQEVAGAQSSVDQAQAGYTSAISNRDTIQTQLNDAQKNYNKVMSQLANYKDSNGQPNITTAMQIINARYSTTTDATTAARLTLEIQGVQQLFASKAQLEAQIDQLKGQLKSLNSGISAANATVDGAKSKLNLVNAGASDKDVAITEAQVRSAQAAYDLANLNLGYAEVKAPVDGTIVQTNVHLGDMVAPGQAAVSLVDFAKIQVTAYVLETDLENVKVGQTVKLSIDAFPGQTFTGVVNEIGLATASTFNLFSTDNASGNYTKVSQRIPVKINFSGNTNQIIPGMSVTAKIKITK